MKITVDDQHHEQGLVGRRGVPDSQRASGSSDDGRMNGNMVSPTDEIVPRMPSFDHSSVMTSRPSAAREWHRHAEKAQKRRNRDPWPFGIGAQPAVRAHDVRVERVGRPVRHRLASQGVAVNPKASHAPGRA
jgi:hypothetical protein